MPSVYRSSEEIARAAEGLLARLNREGCPPNAVCSHFGVTATVGDIHVALTIPSRDKGPGLLCTIYHRSLNHEATANHHCDRALAVAARLGAAIRDRWNGGDGHYGISIVLDMQPPDNLIRGIGNYYALHSRIFKRTPATDGRFHSWHDWFASSETGAIA